ncbi:MAG: cyclic pyranopterin monophosphate synthase MoaC [Aquificaceae bacterium]|nr:cyclic pyranopterin monophosphate synthase MoaC [Aquificaceae bacterium]
MKAVDISLKPETLREASAFGRIRLKPETVKAIREGKVKKGDVLSACKLAGLMAVKKTPELLPFCHPVSVEFAEVRAELGDDYLEVFALVRGLHKTGYEMEALTAVSVALLTVYDMCKGMDGSMCIEEVRLLEKSGGQSQWSSGLEGVRVKVFAEGSLKELVEKRLLSLGAEVVEEEYQILVSTKPVELSEVWGVSYVINQKLFSLMPGALKSGVRVGLFGGRLCVELQRDARVVEAFFDSFGTLLRGWVDGETL